MGWNAFKAIVNQVDIPVYALGGMGFDDLDLSYNNGASGYRLTKENLGFIELRILHQRIILPHHLFKNTKFNLTFFCASRFSLMS